MKVRGPRCELGTCCNTASVQPVMRFRITRSLGFSFRSFDTIERKLELRVCHACRKKFAWTAPLEEKLRAIEISLPGKVTAKELKWAPL